MTVTETPPVIEVTHLDPLDRALIRRQAVAWAENHLSGITDVETRLREAVELYTAEVAAAGEWATKRDDAIYTLSDKSQYRLKYSLRLDLASGRTRSQLQTTRTKMSDLGAPSRNPEAHLELPEYAREADVHFARGNAVRDIRDKAVGDLIYDHGWDNRPIADIIGTDASQVAHIKRKDPRSKKAGVA